MTPNRKRLNSCTTSIASVVQTLGLIWTSWRENTCVSYTSHFSISWPPVEKIVFFQPFSTFGSSSWTSSLVMTFPDVRRYGSQRHTAYTRNNQVESTNPRIRVIFPHIYRISNPPFICAQSCLAVRIWRVVSIHICDRWKEEYNEDEVADIIVRRLLSFTDLQRFDCKGASWCLLASFPEDV